MDEELLHDVAQKHEVDAELLRELIAFEAPKVHLEKRRGAKEGLRKIIEARIDDEGEAT
jgi:hypothetical protein